MMEVGRGVPTRRELGVEEGRRVREAAPYRANCNADDQKRYPSESERALMAFS